MTHIKKRVKILIFPNIITLGNVLFGYLSILSTFHVRYSKAAFLIILAAVADALDGIFARLSKTHSDLGTQLDSLADAVSFGVAPAILIYFWGFQMIGSSGEGLFFCFIFLAAGILRLARYNVLQAGKAERRYYTGLTIPSASLLIASIVLYHPQPLVSETQAFLLALLVVIIVLCMISTIKYRNFLHFNFRREVDIKTALLLAAVFSSLIFYRKILLVAYFSLNLISGPAVYVLKKLRRKLEPEAKTVKED
jgi:CDP-diacylglycerol--serine O-phosphatidyltransferase